MFIPSDPVQYKVNTFFYLRKKYNFLSQVWAFVTSPFFEYLIFAAICINTVLLAMGFYNQVPPTAKLDISIATKISIMTNVSFS